MARPRKTPIDLPATPATAEAGCALRPAAETRESGGWLGPEAGVAPQRGIAC